MKPQHHPGKATSGRASTSGKSSAYGTAGAAPAVSPASMSSEKSSQGPLREPMKVPRWPGDRVDRALAAIGAGRPDSPAVLQVLSLLPNRVPDDLLLFPRAYSNALECGGFLDYQARFTREDIMTVHWELLRRSPEALDELLEDYENRILPPCPPKGLSPTPDEPWALSLLRDVVFYLF